MLKESPEEGGAETAERALPCVSQPFTDRYLMNLRPRGTRYEVLDPRRQGLTLRVTEKGAKTFCFRYKRGGHAVRVVIGPYGRPPLVTLQRAYEVHAELTRKVRAGEEVRSTGTPGVRGRGAALPPAEAILTVGELAQEFATRYLRVERKHPAEAERVIETNIVRYWRTRDARKITRRDGVLLLDKVVDRGRPVMANRVGALLTQMFRFAVTRGMMEASPFVALGKPGGSEKGRKRKRRLDEREIRVFWKKLTRSRLNAEVRIALKLILVTAQRPGEVALAAWSEFDLKRRIWTIPPERAKNGIEHPVPLSDFALLLIGHLRRRFGESPYLIPSRCWRAKNDGPITVRALSQGIRDRRKHFGMPNFTPHDLRRTAASLMTASGIPRLHVEKVLNHTIDDVAEIYDRHDYSEEKRAALQRLAERLHVVLRSRHSSSDLKGERLLAPKTVSTTAP